MAHVSVSEAARLIGQTRTPIYNAIKKGAISAAKNDLGQTVIETSELFRVFSPAAANDDKNTGDNTENSLKNSTESKPQQAENTRESAVLAALLAVEKEKNAMLAETVADLRGERDRLIGVVESQTEQVRLLTDQRDRSQAVATAPAARGWWFWPWG